MEEKFTTSVELSGGEILLVLGLAGLLCISCLCAAAGLSAEAGRVFVSYSRLTIDLGLTSLFLALVRLVLTKEMRETVYIVSDKYLVRKSPYRLATIYYDTITRFRFVHIPFVYSSGLIRYPGGSLRIPFRVNNLSGFIEAVRDMMVKAGTAAAFDEANLTAYGRMAAVVEQAGNRLRRFMPNCVGVMLVFCTVNVMTVLSLWRFPFFMAFFWAICGLLFFFAGIMAAEYAIAARAKRTVPAPEPPDKTPDEIEIYLLVGIAVLVVFWSCGIALKTAYLM